MNFHRSFVSPNFRAPQDSDKMPDNTRPNLISCGMYAFTPNLQDAWLELLQNLHHHLPTPFNQAFDIHLDDATDILKSPNLFIGQTCGYPYITKWVNSHNLVCVPQFSINGCQQKTYSSRILTHANSTRSKLEDFSDSIAVINNTDSNSGMNVFRYEVSKHADSSAFFSKVLVSDSHLTSMQMITAGKADIAAIDSATYAFAVQQGVIDSADFKLIGQTVSTTGLPFIIPKEINIDPTVIVDALNSCLAELPQENKDHLQISNFVTVEESDYTQIIELERTAQQRGYPEIL
jgi:ABC-type phosphate/phosphonate transport system substrate-binding protein